MTLLRTLFTGRSSLRLALAVIALLAGIDDALEVIAKVEDIFHLDTHHGVISLSLLSFSKALNDTVDDVVKAREKVKESAQVRGA